MAVFRGLFWSLHSGITPGKAQVGDTIRDIKKSNSGLPYARQTPSWLYSLSSLENTLFQYIFKIIFTKLLRSTIVLVRLPMDALF